MKRTVLFGLFSLFVSLSVQAKLHGSRVDLFEIYRNDIRGKSNIEIYRDSINDYDRFVGFDTQSHLYTPNHATDFHKPRTLSQRNAEQVLDAALYNPVVGLHMNSKYDPHNKGIGFCFGRAMFVHMYLAMNNLHRGSIKKAFIIGPMSRGEWAWHVTTIVQSTDARGREIWLAIDPVADEVMEVKQWYNNWRKVSDDGKLRLYITDAHKFGAGASWYSEDKISIAFYNHYFRDMMRWFERNDITSDIKH
jgi:hypothetical protein